MIRTPYFFNSDASSEVLASFFDTQGYLVFPNFFDPETLDALNTELHQHFAAILGNALGAARSRDEAKTFDCDVIPWDPVAEDNRLFRRVHADDRMNALTAKVLGDGFGVGSSLVMYSVGGGKGQAWHQDCPSEATDAFNLNRLIYTEDVSAKDGALVFVPGSHRLGVIPPGGHQDTMADEVMLCPTAGTLALLHGHVFHRVTPNLNQRPRVSANFRAYPAGIDPSVNCIGVYRNGSVNFCDQPKRHDGTPAEGVLAK